MCKSCNFGRFHYCILVETKLKTLVVTCSLNAPIRSIGKYVLYADHLLLSLLLQKLQQHAHWDVLLYASVPILNFCCYVVTIGLTGCRFFSVCVCVLLLNQEDIAAARRLLGCVLQFEKMQFVHYFRTPFTHSSVQQHSFTIIIQTYSKQNSFAAAHLSMQFYVLLRRVKCIYKCDFSCFPLYHFILYLHCSIAVQQM